MNSNQCIKLERDHMGINPLYYYMKDDVFYYAKDMREIIAKPDVDLSLNEKWFYLEFSGANSLTLTETEFKYINAIRPGSRCEFTKVNNTWQMKEEIYWTPGDTKYHFDTDEEYVAKLRELIETSIKELADKIEGPIGCELSGGLDSSVIAILLHRMGYDVRFVSWSLSPERYPIQEVDERAVIEDICKQENITCDYFDEDVPGVDFALNHNYPPFVNTLSLSQTSEYFSKLGIKTIFTGHGGDEGVSHRANLLELWHHREKKEYFKELWNVTSGRNLHMLRFIKNAAYGLLIDYPKKKRGWHIKDADLSEYFNSDFKSRMKGTKFPTLYFNFDPQKHIVQGGSRVRIDNCAIQASEFGCNYVFPFLDHRVVDFALSVPRHLYRKDGITRWIYREAFKDIIPKSLYDVKYKDFASLRNFDSSKLRKSQNFNDEDEDSKEYDTQKEWADEILKGIDRDFWSKYIDFDKCEKLLTTPLIQMNKKHFFAIRCLDIQFNKCRMFDNVILKKKRQQL